MKRDGLSTVPFVSLAEPHQAWARPAWPGHDKPRHASGDSSAAVGARKSKGCAP